MCIRYIELIQIDHCLQRCRHIFLATVLLFADQAAFAADVSVIELEIRNHLFQPSTLQVPAHVKIKLIIYNRDASPEEFESYELNREKVIMGNTKSVIFVGPLSPGKYPFFGEFNPKTAQGLIIAE